MYLEKDSLFVGSSYMDKDWCWTDVLAVLERFWMYLPSS